MTKEDIERLAFDEFRRISDCDFDRFEVALPPEPDMVAWRDNDSFGIEITVIHRQSEKAREGEHNKITALSREYYAKGGGPNLDVKIMWAFDHRPAKRNRERLAGKLAKLVQANVPPAKSSAELSWDSFDEELMGAIHNVRVSRLIEFTHNFWHTSGVGYVPACEEKNLQSELDRKQEKPLGYQGDYKEIWLLLASQFSPSSWFEMTEKAAQASYRSTFNRVFLLASFPRKVFELNIERGT